MVSGGHIAPETGNLFAEMTLFRAPLGDSEDQERVRRTVPGSGLGLLWQLPVAFYWRSKNPAENRPQVWGPRTINAAACISDGGDARTSFNLVRPPLNPSLCRPPPLLLLSPPSQFFDVTAAPLWRLDNADRRVYYGAGRGAGWRRGIMRRWLQAPFPEQRRRRRRRRQKQKAARRSPRRPLIAFYWETTALT